jgi:hypothetical protein
VADSILTEVLSPVHAGKQQSSEKDRAPVGVRAEARQHPRFGLYSDPPQWLGSKTGLQTRGEI